MKPVAAAVLMAALIISNRPALSKDDPHTIERALLVEWMVANCDHAKIPAMTVGVAVMVINGFADQRAVSALREKIRAGMKLHYSSTEAGCSELFKGMEPGP